MSRVRVNITETTATFSNTNTTAGSSQRARVPIASRIVNKTISHRSARSVQNDRRIRGSRGCFPSFLRPA